MTKKLGLYLHIPFCEKKCDYCDFVSYCKPTGVKLQYVEDIKKEICAKAITYKDCEVDTIFIGGGTPSSMPIGAINSILNCVYKNFKVLSNAEITIECNPNSLTMSKLVEYKKSKINRLSIGLQTTNNKLLKLIGRLHTKNQFDFAVACAKKVGFNNISADLILGIPKQKLCHVKQELKYLVKLGINHISAYALIVEEGTKLKQNLDENVYKLPSESLQLKMLNFAVKYLTKQGFQRYEVSNFAKVGFESKHNLKYWTDKEYLGLGAVASSYVDNVRWKNTDSLEEYHNQVQSGNFEYCEKEVVDANSNLEETIMLALRTANGINLDDLQNKFGKDLLKIKSKQIEMLISQKLLTHEDGRIFCTNKGFNLLNQIVLMLV